MFSSFLRLTQTSLLRYTECEKRQTETGKKDTIGRNIRKAIYSTQVQKIKADLDRSYQLAPLTQCLPFSYLSRTQLNTLYVDKLISVSPLSNEK